MRPGRRQILRAGALGALAALAGCGSTEPAGGSRGTGLWYWQGGLSEELLGDAKKHFASATALKPTLIPGTYGTALDKALKAGTDLPSIAGIKGEDIASVLPRADLWVDLSTLGADQIAGEYLTWKWQQGSTIDGRLVGIPIDIGPTALFYRADLLGRAGLPTDPKQLDARFKTWPDLVGLGTTLCTRLPGVALLPNAVDVFSLLVGQAGKRFINEANHFVGDGAHIKAAWDTAVSFLDAGLTARAYGGSPSWKQGLAQSHIATVVGAAWVASDVQDAAGSSAGQWRVAAGPAAGANVGGSFLGIPARSGDHDTAFEIIKWLLSPVNQALNFSDASLFPSTPATFAMPALTVPDPFFGNQLTTEVFSASAQRIRRSYEAPADAAIQTVYGDELWKVESSGKAAAMAWNDALAQARTLATKNGVN